MNKLNPVILVRGGGDLASGAVLRLHRAGFRVIVSEIAQPLAVRRLVSFAEAMYAGTHQIEEVIGRRAAGLAEVTRFLDEDSVPVIDDPEAEIRRQLPILAAVDGRMTKQVPEHSLDFAPLIIGLGPGFTAGENCHAVVETQRGPFLGRIYWQGPAAPDSGLPETVGEFQTQRVLRAPADGRFIARKELGQSVHEGEMLAEVAGIPLAAPFDGLLRGLLHDGLLVHKGVKVGDLDPRSDPQLARLVSDKALAVGGGVLEALLSRPEIRAALCR